MAFAIVFYGLGGLVFGAAALMASRIARDLPIWLRNGVVALASLAPLLALGIWLGWTGTVRDVPVLSDPKLPALVLAMAPLVLVAVVCALAGLRRKGR